MRIHIVTDEPVDELAVSAVSALERVWSALEQARPGGSDLRITAEELAVFAANFLVGVSVLSDFYLSHLDEIFGGEEPEGSPEQEAVWASFCPVARAMVIDWQHRITV